MIVESLNDWPMVDTQRMIFINYPLNGKFSQQIQTFPWEDALGVVVTGETNNKGEMSSTPGVGYFAKILL